MFTHQDIARSAQWPLLLMQHQACVPKDAQLTQHMLSVNAQGNGAPGRRIAAHLAILKADFERVIAQELSTPHLVGKRVQIVVPSEWLASLRLRHRGLCAAFAEPARGKLVHRRLGGRRCGRPLQSHCICIDCQHVTAMVPIVGVARLSL